MGAEKGTTWFARLTAHNLDLDNPEDAALWRLICLLFNRVWAHTVPRLAGGADPDWLWAAEQARKGWGAYGIWKDKTGQGTPLDYQRMLEAASAGAAVLRRAGQLPQLPGAGAGAPAA